MFQIRKASDRGHANHGWLDTYHTFSFADYYDEAHMGFASLRVINEDWVDGGAGFATHPHRNMEILTFVLEGALEHRDTLNNSSVIRPGELQRMSAGTGIKHSEKNHYADQKTHLYQIWILPDRDGYEPSYEQKSFQQTFDQISKTKELALVASQTGRQGSLTIHQDCNVYYGKTDAVFKAAPTRVQWLQVLTGEIKVGDLACESGDGVSVLGESALSIQSLSASGMGSYLLFDMARR